MKNKPLDEYVAEMGREKTKKLQNKIKRRRDFAGVLLFSLKLYFYEHILKFFFSFLSLCFFLFLFSFSFKKREKKEKEVFSQPLYLPKLTRRLKRKARNTQLPFSTSTNRGLRRNPKNPPSRECLLRRIYRA